MPSYPCPICGDPSAFPIWIDEEPPIGCPNDESWHETGRPAITTMCQQQRIKAEQRADWRKHNPECFDANGNMRPGKLAHVLTEWAKRNPGARLQM